mmetsp:Transcript_102233/g.329860  ORF Transcript_102233/g.329860 Transcript_102233/m.329860 type:complete len:330 (-) Transcript_102233:434-1423(-)
MPSVGKIQDADVKDTRWCARLDLAWPATIPSTRRPGSLAWPSTSSAGVVVPWRGCSLGSPKPRRSPVETRLLPALKVAWEAADRSLDSSSGGTNGARRLLAKSDGCERAWLPVLGGRSDGDDLFDWPRDCPFENPFDWPRNCPFENPFAGASFSDSGSDTEPSREDLDRDVSLQAQEADGDRRARLLELRFGLGAEQGKRGLRKLRRGWETPDDGDLDAGRLEYSGMQGRQRRFDIRDSSHGSPVLFARSAPKCNGELGRSPVEGADSTDDCAPLPHTVLFMKGSELFSTEVELAGFQPLQSERCEGRTFKGGLGVAKQVLRLGKWSTW